MTISLRPVSLLKCTDLILKLTKSSIPIEQETTPKTNE